MSQTAKLNSRANLAGEYLSVGPRRRIGIPRSPSSIDAVSSFHRIANIKNSHYIDGQGLKSSHTGILRSLEPRLSYEMVPRATVVLQETLRSLNAEKLKIERKIAAVRSALAVIAGPRPHLIGRRKRKPMTPAERRSVSRRMKAYWARRRAKANS